MNIDDCNWDLCSFFELSDIGDAKIRDKYVSFYYREFKRLEELYPTDELQFGLSISELYHSLEEIDEPVSTYLFPKDTVFFYPKVEVLVAKKMHTCHISGAVIPVGCEYISYHAFLYNQSKHQAYVTPNLVMEVGSLFSLPMTLEEFEALCYRVYHAYELNLEDEYNLECSLNCPLVRKLSKKSKIKE